VGSPVPVSGMMAKPERGVLLTDLKSPPTRTVPVIVSSGTNFVPPPNFGFQLFDKVSEFDRGIFIIENGETVMVSKIQFAV